MKPLIRWTRLAGLAALASCTAGPRDLVIPPPPPPITGVIDPSLTIEPVFGTVPVGFVGEQAESKVSVVVRRNGVAAQGVPVFWGVQEGKIVPTSTVTDVNGIASDSVWFFGPTLGTQTAWAALGSQLGNRVTFEAQVSRRRAPLAAINVAFCPSDPPATELAGSRTRTPFVVCVTDSLGTGIADVRVEFVTTSPEQAWIPQSGVTDVLGRASATPRLATGGSGIQTFLARLATDTAVTGALRLRVRGMPAGVATPTVWLTLDGSSRFIPELLSVARGTSILFRWEDGPHGMHFVSAPAAMVDVDVQGESFSTVIRFDTPGVYVIQCPNHGTGAFAMRMTVTVT